MAKKEELLKELKEKHYLKVTNPDEWTEEELKELIEVCEKIETEEINGMYALKILDLIEDGYLEQIE